jgi:hypothetical protein
VKAVAKTGDFWNNVLFVTGLEEKLNLDATGAFGAVGPAEPRDNARETVRTLTFS